jgi:hypothetical protein
MAMEPRGEQITVGVNTSACSCTATPFPVSIPGSSCCAALPGEVLHAFPDTAFTGAMSFSLYVLFISSSHYTTTFTLYSNSMALTILDFFLQDKRGTSKGVLVFMCSCVIVAVI